MPQTPISDDWSEYARNSLSSRIAHSERVRSGRYELYSGVYIMSAQKKAGKSTLSLAIAATIRAEEGVDAWYEYIDESGSTVQTPALTGRAVGQDLSLPSSGSAASAGHRNDSWMAEAVDTYIDRIAKRIDRDRTSVVIYDSATMMFEMAAGLVQSPARSGGYVPGYAVLAERVDQLGRDLKCAIILVVNASLFNVEDLDAQTTGIITMTSSSQCFINERPTGRNNRTVVTDPRALEAAMSQLAPNRPTTTTIHNAAAIPGMLGS